MNDASNDDTQRALDLGRIALAYGTAAAVGLGAGWVTQQLLPIEAPWISIAAGGVAATTTVFAFSVAWDNSSVYDPFWSVAPMIYAPALAFGVNSRAPLARRLLVVSLVEAWGARLTYNWARGWTGMRHEDWRYVDLRAKTGPLYWPTSFAGLHMMPTAMVLLGCLPLVPALISGERPLGWRDALAFAVTAGAIALEATADEQLRRFRLTNDTPGKILNEGLWAHSRHPNYLGEIGFWWGLAMFGAAARPGSRWRAAGALAITGLFKLASIPMIDARSKERRPGYADHMKRVPALIPRLFRRLRGA